MEKCRNHSIFVSWLLQTLSLQSLAFNACSVLLLNLGRAKNYSIRCFCSSFRAHVLQCFAVGACSVQQRRCRILQKRKFIHFSFAWRSLLNNGRGGGNGRGNGSGARSKYCNCLSRRSEQSYDAIRCCFRSRSHSDHDQMAQHGGRRRPKEGLHKFQDDLKEARQGLLPRQQQ